MAMLSKLRHRWKGFRFNLPDSSIFVRWRCPEAHSANFITIRVHPTYRFCLAVDALGLRRSGSWPQIINQAQDIPEQFPRRAGGRRR